MVSAKSSYRRSKIRMGMGCMIMGISLMHLGASSASAANDPMWDAFTNPPAEAKVFRIEHNWPLDTKQVEQRINTAKEMGFGGYVSSLPLNNEYAVTENNFNALINAAKAINEKGMLNWFYDENGYPSGRAGTLVLKDHPELEAQCIMTQDLKMKGGDHTITLPPGQIMSAAAYRGDEIIDLKAKAQGDQLAFNLPDGYWQVVVVTQGILYTGTQVDGNASPVSAPTVDLLNPDTTTRFIEVTHDELAKRMGPDIGKSFVSLFTDEPSTLAFLFKRQNYGILPWSSVMLKEFKQRRGYDLAPKIAALAAGVLPDTEKVRCDYFTTVTELFSENFFGQLKTWAAKHNTLSGGHALLEENVVHHAPLYGDLFVCLQTLDAPGIDVLSSDPRITRTGTLTLMDSHVPYDAARFASSVAQVDGSRLVMMEISDHIQNMGGAPLMPIELYRGAYNRMLWGGISAWNTYSSFNRHEKQDVQGLLQYTARVNAVLFDGYRVADVGLLYPIESVWAHFTPSRSGADEVSPECVTISNVQRDVTRSLFEGMRDYDYLHSTGLAKASIKNGELVIGQSSYRAVVLPAVDTIPQAAWATLVKFWKAGGRILFVGTKPANTTEQFPAAQIAADVKAMLNDPSGRVKFIAEKEALSTSSVIDQWLSPQLKASDNANLRMTHRRKDGYDLYFVINESDQAWNGTIEITGKQAELWEPIAGTRKSLGSGKSAQTSLEPWAGMILRMKSAKRSEVL